MKILVLGATGMLGSAMMRRLAESAELDVLGTIRSEEAKSLFLGSLAARLLVLRDVQENEGLTRFFNEVRPNAVVNCVSPSRKALIEGDPLQVIPICALLPHRLARICGELGARLIHISTDGVFSGGKGGYTEEDQPDATDVYGLSKHLGELRDPHTFTIRTSIIGHELRSSNGLLEWFLSQEKRCNCYGRAVFSGLPAIVLAQIVRDVVLPRPELSGVYHIAAEPITKCELLRLVAEVYGKSIEIVPDERLAIDRSLNAGRFRRATGYVAPDWRTLIQVMHSSR
jgi:dTDP-4-dehydrorhamnose reductase